MENQEPEIEKLVTDEAPAREPDQKKLKISTTDGETDISDPAGGNGGREGRKTKYRRRKVAIVFAFCGVGYQGMQKNPGAKTIEGEFEEALFHAGGVPEADRNQPRLYEWARAARTDKGVSAVGQVVSGRFYVDPPGFVERLNSNLPDQIRVFGYKRVAPSFSAKKFCDRRRYVYLIPVFALDPCSHCEAVRASEESGQEYIKCVECSKRGYRIPLGVMGRETSCDAKSLDISSSSCDASRTDNKCETLSGEDNITSELPDEANVPVSLKPENPDLDQKSDVTMMQDEGCKLNLDSSMDSDASAEKEVKNTEEKDTTESESKIKSEFCYGEKEKERLNRILSYYVGSHNFHNFTTRTKAQDPAANRYILSFNANSVVNLDGIDFVKCEVVGQSFMLHQIRKMIGLAVAVMRNYAAESLIQTAFRKDVNINVPMAPEVGLYLDECIFTSYNKRFKNTHEEVSMEVYKELAEEFKWKHVYSHIGSAEQKDGAVAIWLHSLNQRNYPDLRADNNEHTPGQVIVYKKIEEVSDKKTLEEKVTVDEEASGTAELCLANDVISEENTLEENTTG